ncbi:hypothetical protein Gohar_004528 [Gossypium harknessii]|uniref:Uncharacterized protein n=1 Tax=Gossypium harknessii TaxID=34285 RepID=A0A7J9H5U2_9ROSI|nr:hypothetical protein [Gossypium harknessii]
MLSTLEGKIVKLEGSVGDMKESLKLTERGDALEAMVATLKKIEGLLFCKAIVGNRVLAATPKPNMDAPKPKEFKGTRSARNVDNVL